MFVLQSCNRRAAFERDDINEANVLYVALASRSSTRSSPRARRICSMRASTSCSTRRWSRSGNLRNFLKRFLGKGFLNHVKVTIFLKHLYIKKYMMSSKSSLSNLCSVEATVSEYIWNSLTCQCVWVNCECVTEFAISYFTQKSVTPLWLLCFVCFKRADEDTS
ncbi:unnamed protein product [Urochloa humidicola]